MALVLTCVVETGMPVRVASRMHRELERSAEKPWYFSSLTMSMPTDLMIFSPPTEVPTPMTTEQSSMSHTGMSMFSTLGWPLQNATPRNNTPMNF